MSNKDVLHFIDTSVLRFLVCATTEARKYYEGALGPKKYICKYIQMEFVRAFVITLIEYYFVLAMPNSKHINDANILWSNKFSKRKLSNVLMFVQQLFGSHQINFSAPGDKSKALRLLSDYIRRLLEKINTKYIDTGSNATRCTLPIRFSSYNPSDTDSSLNNFWEAFKDKEFARVNCSIERCLLNKYASEVNILLESEPPSLKSDRKGYDKLIEYLSKLCSNPKKLTCTTCSKIGDIVISLVCPSNMRLEHTDFSFDYIMALLNKQHYRHPSETSLNK